MLENNIRDLIKILEESNIDEIEISTFWGKQRIRIRKNQVQQTDINKEILHEVPAKKEPNNSELTQFADNTLHETKENAFETSILETQDSMSDDTLCIKAPLVGTYYCSPTPNDPPFITEGDIIKKGQVICIIEAMKIFNEIESDFSGKVEKILIKDSTPVEYDQDLIVILPE